MDSPDPVCELRGIRKAYGAVQALAGVDLTIYPGQVHAVVGENGAGKSTLMKILAGAESPDDGEMLIRGKPSRFGSVVEARRSGVAIVFQELSLFPDLDVLANLAVFRVDTKCGFVSHREMRELVRSVVDELGIDVDLRRPVGQLDLHERQLVEIARALLADASILILDEPNSALNAAESERLFQIISELAARGTAILYISHRLEEVFRVADTITVLRNGFEVSTMPREETSIPEVVRAMIGRSPTRSPQGAQAPAESDRPALRLRSVDVNGRLNDVTLEAASGEVLGLAGLEGAGQRTVFDLVFGVASADGGEITLPDGAGAPRSVRQAVQRGVALVPADRILHGLMLEQTVAVNTAEVKAGALGQLGWILRRRDLGRASREWIERLGIVTRSPHTPVVWLSGGNQQKVVLAKWLAIAPAVVLLDDPTRGVDVGAKSEIYEIARQLAEEGRIVLFYSTELPEYFSVCDRVVIFFQGRVAAQRPAAELTEQQLLEAINTGSLPQPAAA